MFTRALAVLVGVVVGCGGVELTAVLVEDHTQSQLTERVEPLRAANYRLRGLLSDASEGLRTGDTSRYDVAASGYTVAAEDLRAAARRGDVSVQAQLVAADGWWALAALERDAGPDSPYATAGEPLFREFADASDDLEMGVAARTATLRRRLAVLRWVSAATIAALTAFVAAFVIYGARRGTRPLRRIAEVLDRRREGDRTIRVGPVVGPPELVAAASAVDAAIDQAELIRDSDETIERQRSGVRRLGYRIRAHLDVGDGLDEAVRGLATTMNADHVLIRMAGEPTGNDAARLASTGNTHLDGLLAELAGCDTGWLSPGDVWTADGPGPLGRDTDVRPPERERTAWSKLGGGPLLTVAVGDGSSCFGAITMVRDPGRPEFSPAEVRLTEAVAYDIGRGVYHGRLFERERLLVARLKALDTAKSDFMSTVSHELRTPLTSISGYLELLMEGEGGAMSDAHQRMLEVIRRNTRRLRELIEDILTLSKIESGEFRTEHRPVDLAAIVGRAVTAIGPAAAKATVGLHLDVRPPLSVEGDGVQLDRVLANLLSNAVKFTAPDGTVTVHAESRDDAVWLTISDTGMGIPADEQSALFARFFRATNAIHHAIPGTGLGLAIVHKIVRNHDGTIEIASTENVGTTVTVCLPAR